MTWFKSTPESDLMLSEERLILAATESVYEAMDRSHTQKKDIAAALGVSKSEIGQRLSGRRNLTVRSLAAMLHAAGFEATIAVRPLTGAHQSPRDDLHEIRRFKRQLQPTKGSYTQVPVNQPAAMKVAE